MTKKKRPAASEGFTPPSAPASPSPLSWGAQAPLEEAPARLVPLVEDGSLAAFGQDDGANGALTENRGG